MYVTIRSIWTLLSLDGNTEFISIFDLDSLRLELIDTNVQYNSQTIGNIA